MNPFLTPSTKSVADLLESAIIKRFKEGRGQGYGKSYLPFLTVRDVPSKGRVHRRPSITHGRIVHLLSDLELAAFLLFDWHESVVDIREQFPLDPEKTTAIADRLGIKHPAAKGFTQVMTTDLMVDIMRNGTRLTQAVSVKYRQDLDDPRVIEKQEIEKRFWEAERIEFLIFTENEVPSTLIQNIKWLMSHIDIFELNEADQRRIFNQILHAIETYPGDKIGKVMKLLDANQTIPDGSHLKYLRHLLAQGAFYWDMNNLNHRSLKTSNLIANKFWISGEQEYVYAK